MEKEEVLKECNVAELDKEISADDFFIYTQALEAENKKKIEKLELNKPKGVIDKVICIADERIDEDSATTLLEIIEIYEANENKQEWEDISAEFVSAFSQIFNNLLEDFEGKDCKQIFRYNLINKIKRIIVKLRENKKLKDFIKEFENESKFFDRLVEREKEYLEERKQVAEKNKRKMNEEKRQKRLEAERKFREQHKQLNNGSAKPKFDNNRGPAQYY